MKSAVLTFRPMALTDLDRIMEIEHLCFTMPWSRDAFVAELTQNHFAHYLVVEKDGQVIGYGGMWLILDEAHVTNIAIHPEQRGKGYGEELLRRMMALSIARGGTAMTLEVRVSNLPAQRLYEKMGFVSHGIRKGYYTDNNEDALIMWVELPRAASASYGWE
jgi:ribosomal-protein-alanine N-acetyltransferase